MEPLEDEWKRFLARRPAPPGFTAAVMARIRVEGRRSASALWRTVLAGAIAASLVVAGVLWQNRTRAERLRAEQARDQIILSLQLAGSGIEKARQAVLRLAGDPI